MPAKATKKEAKGLFDELVGRTPEHVQWNVRANAELLEEFKRLCDEDGISLTKGLDAAFKLFIQYAEAKKAKIKQR
jgi:hypothetical protein